MLLKKPNTLLLLILLIAAFLRFYNLMHDSPHFFNPDERNMAHAVSQFRLPNNLSQIPICLISQISPIFTYNLQLTTYNCNLNPRFFAYGQFPLYLTFISDQVIQSFWQVPINGTRPESQWDPGQARMTTFPSAIFWLRFWSAVSSTLTVLLVYPVTNMLINRHSGKRGTSASRIPVGSWTSQDDNLGLNIGHYAALIAAFTPGLIQSAHFGTTESLLTFFFFASVYLSLSYLSNLSHLRYLLLLSLSIGLALGSKLSGIFFFVPPFVAIFISTFSHRHFEGVLTRSGRPRNLAKRIILVTLPSVARFLTMFGMTMGISILVFILSSPYNLVEFDNFKSAVFGYERDVATGKYPAFYTKQFVDTIPILFQTEKVFPYALGWPVFILGTGGFLLINLQLLIKLTLLIIQKVQSSKFKVQSHSEKFKISNFDLQFLILNFSFLTYFFPNSFLFAKWTRFMTPIFPFFAIFSVFALFRIYSVLSVFRSKFPISNFQFPINAKNLLGYWVIGLLVFISVLPGVAFMSIYTHEDSRVIASKWIYQNIPNGSYILSETANVVDIPLGLTSPSKSPLLQGEDRGEVYKNNYTVISFDFYHLDENPLLFEQLLAHLEKAGYIFIPSRRIFANYMRLSKTYPMVTKYYQLLFSGRLGFEKVVEIASYPTLTLPLCFDDINHCSKTSPFSVSFPDEKAEETFTVFDHPVIRIYKKTIPKRKEEYKTLFNNGNISRKIAL